jgi:hypothetical protein
MEEKNETPRVEYEEMKDILKRTSDSSGTNVKVSYGELVTLSDHINKKRRQPFKNTVSILPEPIVEMIFAWALDNVQALGRMSLVCKSWRDTCKRVTEKRLDTLVSTERGRFIAGFVLLSYMVRLEYIETFWIYFETVYSSFVMPMELSVRHYRPSRVHTEKKDNEEEEGEEQRRSKLYACIKLIPDYENIALQVSKMISNMTGIDCTVGLNLSRMPEIAEDFLRMELMEDLEKKGNMDELKFYGTGFRIVFSGLGEGCTCNDNEGNPTGEQIDAISRQSHIVFASVLSDSNSSFKPFTRIKELLKERRTSSDWLRSHNIPETTQRDVSFDWVGNIMASEEHRKDFYSLLGPIAFMFKQ